jgi:hypothetical protein
MACIPNMRDRRRVGHLVLGGLCAVAFTGQPASSGELDLLGAVSMRGVVAVARTPWLAGGFGRLGEGGDGTHHTLRGELHLGADWSPSPTWLVHAHGVAHGEPSSYLGQRAGLTEAFVQFRPELTPAYALRFRAGLFFTPTSLENTDPLWQSPYTITLSALNTWIGEEVRLTGIEGALQHKGTRGRLELAGTIFVANDPSGALLAWRGWTVGDRLSTVGEILPLPPIESFRPGGAFADQRDDGTRPFDELDTRPGYAARARASVGALRVQAAFTDNRGDRRLERRQYSWETRFGQAGLELRLGPQVTLVAEGALGDTGMGPAAPGGPQVQLRFRSGYALVSWNRGAWRLSARMDGFENEDRDRTAELDDESGWALTTAAFWKPSRFVRLGIEYADVRGDRAAGVLGDASSGKDRRGVLEVRLAF